MNNTGSCIANYFNGLSDTEAIRQLAELGIAFTK